MMVAGRPSGGAVGPATSEPLSESQRGLLRTLTPNREPSECAVFAEYGRNYLTPVDLVVKHAETNKVCIRARFALSIRVEEAETSGPQPENEHPHRTHEHVERPILGYVPLEHELRVEESCPGNFVKKLDPDGDNKDADKKDQPGETGTAIAPTASKENKPENEQAAKDEEEEKHTREIREATTEEDTDKEEDDELDLIVTFDCGKLSFTFKRDKSKIYISAIKGVVQLDKKNLREFIANRPMFLTSDLDHHFKYSDEIEVVSEVQSGKHILTAVFYDTEFEAFRDTTSRDFVNPPDENSKPFPDEIDDTEHESQEKPLLPKQKT